MANLTYKELEQLLLEIFEINELTPVITRQLNKYALEYNMSWLEIARCVSWQMDSNGGKYNPAFGIGFVPNVRVEAKAYFEELARKKAEQEKEAKILAEKEKSTKVIIKAKNMSKWNKLRKPKLIDVNTIIWDEEGVDGAND